MTTTHQRSSADERICDEPNKVKGLTIAELRSRFQKDSDVVFGYGKAPLSVTSHGGHVISCSPEKVEKMTSLSSYSSEKSDFKEKLQKFDHGLHEQSNSNNHPTSRSLPQKPTRLTAPKDNNKSSSDSCNADKGNIAKVLEAVTERAGTENRVWKPAVPSKSAKRMQTDCSSPYKLPKPLPPPRDPSKTYTIDVCDEDSNSETRSKSPNLALPMSMKPNPSHLSSLISEMQQQLLPKRPGISHSGQNLKSRDDDLKSHSSLSLAPASTNCPNSRESGERMTLNCGSTLEMTTITYLNTLWKPKQLPPLELLGLPPQKPSRPPINANVVIPPKVGFTPPLPDRNPSMNNIELCLNSITSTSSTPPQGQAWTAYIKDDRTPSRCSSSPIPEFTEEEELGSPSSPTELYADTLESSSHLISTGIKSSTTSLHSHTLQSEDLYHDTVMTELGQSDDLYEDVGVAERTPSESSSLTYGTKDGDSRKKENDKKLKKQQKEIEKKLRETEKQRKKFNLTGNEVAVDAGFVKESVKGRRRDNLTVNKGEMVTVLRISNNPVGKWLVRNEEGKVGYVDISNIEVDASSIRYPKVVHHEVIPLVDKHIPLPDKLQTWFSRLTLCVR